MECSQIFSVVGLAMSFPNHLVTCSSPDVQGSQSSQFAGDSPGISSESPNPGNLSVLGTPGWLFILSLSLFKHQYPHMQGLVGQDRHMHQNSAIRSKEGNISRVLNNGAFTMKVIIACFQVTDLVLGFIISTELVFTFILFYFILLFCGSTCKLSEIVSGSS